MRQYLRNIYGTVWTSMLGMRITMGEFFTPAVTREYPEHHPDIPEGSRNRLHNEMGDCVVCLACANDCPVDCIHEGTDQFYIEPDECIDCGVCEPECPVEAIFEEDAVPEQWTDYIKKNYAYFDK